MTHDCISSFFAVGLFPSLYGIIYFLSGIRQEVVIYTVRLKIEYFVTNEKLTKIKGNISKACSDYSVITQAAHLKEQGLPATRQVAPAVERKVIQNARTEYNLCTSAKNFVILVKIFFKVYIYAIYSNSDF